MIVWCGTVAKRLQKKKAKGRNADGNTASASFLGHTVQFPR
jgi:hypothetical protein